MTDRSGRGHKEPADPNFRSVIAASLARQGFLASLGAQLERVDPGEVVIALPFSERVGQQHGFFHGACLGAIGDSAGGYAALSLMPAGSEVVTVEYKINFLRPALGPELVASGRVLRAGKSLTVAQVDIVVRRDGGDVPVGLIQGTFMRVSADA